MSGPCSHPEAPRVDLWRQLTYVTRASPSFFVAKRTRTHCVSVSVSQHTATGLFPSLGCCERCPSERGAHPSVWGSSVHFSWNYWAPGQLRGASLAAEHSRLCLQCMRCRFTPWVRKVPWRRKWQPTPGLWPGKSHGQRSLVGCSPRGCTESDRPGAMQRSRAGQLHSEPVDQPPGSGTAVRQLRAH